MVNCPLTLNQQINVFPHCRINSINGENPWLNNIVIWRASKLAHIELETANINVSKDSCLEIMKWNLFLPSNHCYL